MLRSTGFKSVTACSLVNPFPCWGGTFALWAHSRYPHDGKEFTLQASHDGAFLQAAGHGCVIRFEALSRLSFVCQDLAETTTLSEQAMLYRRAVRDIITHYR